MNLITKNSVVLAALMFALPAFAKPVTAVLKLKEKISMESLADNVQNPLSPRYQKFYTPEEIRQLSAPSDAEYTQLLTQLKAQGFTIQNESPTHLWVSVKGDSAQFESVFATKLQYKPTGERHVMMTPTIPSEMALIDSVGGLNSTRKAHPKFVRSSAVTPQDDMGGIAQSTIKTAYGFDNLYTAGLSGKGQHIAIATYMNLHLDDVNYFYKASSLNPVPTVDVVTFNGTAQYDANSAMESELDAEFTGMIAPGAAIHVFASSTNDDAGELQIFTAILDDNRAKVANYSWGSCETTLDPSHKADMQTIFARAVAQGVNIMVASGDSGSDSCGDGTNAADWPGAAPYVVTVGGTSFAQNGTALAETAWSGSGGGISAIWDLPAWQTQLGAPYLKRSYPDVAFNADPATGQAIWTDGQGTAGWMVIGGTSMAAPQWSGFMALVGEARATANKATIGYLNPVIYGLNATDRAAAFHDVTSGSNGLYNAGPGWDAVTGWGSMQADALLGILKAN